MGVGCLVAAFWFGAYLQDRPVGQNQTVALLPDGTIDPNASIANPNLLEKTQGFLSSLFESPAKEKPITVNQLRARSQTEIPNVRPLDLLVSAGGDRVQISDSENENLQRLTGASQAVVQQSQLVEGFRSSPATRSQHQNGRPAGPKVAIVPDFSTLAEEVNRGLSFSAGSPDSAVPDTRKLELIPVPTFSDVDVNSTAPLAEDTDWESIRSQVAAAESRLENYRQQITQPIPEIVDSVKQRTGEFWNRQQAQSHRQSAISDLATSTPLNPAREQRLKPESWTEKQKRWDVFSQNRSTPLEDRAPNASSSNRSQGSQQQRQPEIVEVDRGFVSRRSQVAGDASARVRSLNDDRFKGAPFSSADNRNAFTAAQQFGAVREGRRSEIQNELRPQYNPNPGSQPEFVSPPDYGQFAPKTNTGASEIVEAATVTYGSFRQYETLPNDTLQTISTKFYGTADYYFDLYLANRDLLSNPATVPQGVTIKIPKFDGR